MEWHLIYIPSQTINPQKDEHLKITPDLHKIYFPYYKKLPGITHMRLYIGEILHIHVCLYLQSLKRLMRHPTCFLSSPPPPPPPSPHSLSQYIYIYIYIFINAVVFRERSRSSGCDCTVKFIALSIVTTDRSVVDRLGVIAL